MTDWQGNGKHAQDEREERTTFLLSIAEMRDFRDFANSLMLPKTWHMRENSARPEY
jgi:hypothetical protein